MGLSRKDILYFESIVLGLINMPEIKKIDEFIQHGNVSCLNHSISVAYVSYYICKKYHINVNYPNLIRGALLHDYFLYDWHIKDKDRPLHAFYHPIRAYHNASKVFVLTNIEKDIILKHMWPLTLKMPKYKESYIVCLSDKICSVAETIRMNHLIPQIRL